MNSRRRLSLCTGMALLCLYWSHTTEAQEAKKSGEAPGAVAGTSDRGKIEASKTPESAVVSAEPAPAPTTGTKESSAAEVTPASQQPAPGTVGTAVPEQPPVEAKAPPPNPVGPPIDLERPLASIKEPPKKQPRTFALGLTLLKEHGFGATLRLRFNYVAIDVAYGLYPVILLIQTPYGTTSDIKAGVGLLHLDGGCVFFINDDQRRFQSGIRLAGIYDNIMGGGVMLGYAGEVLMGKFALGFGAGLQIFPGAEDRMKDYFDLDEGTTFSPLMGTLQIYIGVNVLWYIF